MYILTLSLFLFFLRIHLFSRGEFYETFFFHFEANSYLHILFGGVVVDHVPLAFFFCFLFSCWFSTKGGRTINLCLFQFFLWVLFVPFRNRFCKTKSKKEKRRTSTLVACVSLWPNATCSFHYKKKKKNNLNKNRQGRKKKRRENIYYFVSLFTFSSFSLSKIKSCFSLSHALSLSETSTFLLFPCFLWSVSSPLQPLKQSRKEEIPKN